jgi:tartrate-resistant acid phosphatase type 5
MASSVRQPTWLVTSWSLLLLLSACVGTPRSADDRNDNTLDVGILIFGDSGFHLDYPRQWDYDRPFPTEAEYRQYELQKWLNDKRPIADFESVPLDISPVTGSIVPASGMRQVSTAMSDFCRNSATCNFGLMLGDNIYPRGATLGADGVLDSIRFDDILSKPFGHLVDHPENFLTYAVLGNHDWFNGRAAGFAQIKYLENADGFYMDGPFYSVKPPAGMGQVELFVIDTDMILATVPVYEAHLNADGSERASDVVAIPEYVVEPMSNAERNIIQWLERGLRQSTARWKFVVAHHPLWSSKAEKFQQTRALRNLILPTVCRYADGYFAGHAHTLEIHTDSCAAALGEPTELPLVQVISGAASRQRPLHTSFMRHQDLKYPEHKTIDAKGMLWGFAYLHIKGDTAKVTMMSVPDDGGDEISVEFEYEFERRSPLNQ